MLPKLCSKWWCLLLRGLTAIVAGAIAIAHPGLTAYILAVLIGINALIDGLMCVFVGIRGGTDSKPWWEMIGLGALGVVFGIVALAQPGIVLATLIVLIGIWSIARGAMEIAVAVKLRKVLDDEWILGLSGALSIAFGALLLFKPIEGIFLLGVLIGVFLLAGGLFLAALALRLRTIRNRLHVG